MTLFKCIVSLCAFACICLFLLMGCPGSRAYFVRGENCSNGADSTAHCQWATDGIGVAVGASSRSSGRIRVVLTLENSRSDSLIYNPTSVYIMEDHVPKRPLDYSVNGRPWEYAAALLEIPYGTIRIAFEFESGDASNEGQLDVYLGKLISHKGDMVLELGVVTVDLRRYKFWRV